MGLYGNTDLISIDEDKLIEEFDNNYCIEITEEMLFEDANRKARKKILKRILKGSTKYIRSLGIKAKVILIDNKSDFVDNGKNTINLKVKQSMFEFEDENNKLQTVGYTPENIKQYSKRRNMIDNFKPSDLEKYIRDNYNIEISSNKIDKDLLFKVTVKEQNINEMTEDILYEISQEDEEKNKRLVPIFIVLTYVDWFVANMIKKFSKSEYSHASIAFEPTLSTCYNFNMKGDRYNGFGVETLKKYIKDGCTKIKVMAIMVPPEVKNKVKGTVYEYRKNKDQTSFSVRGLFRVLIGKRMNDKNAMKLFCSQFIAKVLSAHNINISGKQGTDMTKPGDFGSYTEENNFFVVYEGDIKKYSASSVKKRLLELKTKTPYDDLITFKKKEENNEEVNKESFTFKDFVIFSEGLDYNTYSNKSLDEILTEIFKEE